MDIICSNLGGRELLVEEINEVAQIYRFDDFRLQLRKENQQATFDIPSVEWLERFTEILNEGPVHCYRETLRGSGYKLMMNLEPDRVCLDVYDVLTHSIAPLSLSYEEASALHGVVYGAVVQPFLDQGGNMKQLSDVKRFQLRSPM